MKHSLTAAAVHNYYVFWLRFGLAICPRSILRYDRVYRPWGAVCFHTTSKKADTSRISAAALTALAHPILSAPVIKIHYPHSSHGIKHFREQKVLLVTNVTEFDAMVNRDIQEYIVDGTCYIYTRAYKVFTVVLFYGFMLINL